MARLVRVSPLGVSQHIVQRGNNRQVCFAGEEYMKAYLNWLKKFSKKYNVDVHAWVLMINHVHLLCTPQEEGAIGRMYFRYCTTHINVVEPFGKVDLSPVGFKASDTCLSFIDTSN